MYNRSSSSSRPSAAHQADQNVNIPKSLEDIFNSLKLLECNPSPDDIIQLSQSSETAINNTPEVKTEPVSQLNSSVEDLNDGKDISNTIVPVLKPSFPGKENEPPAVPPAPIPSQPSSSVTVRNKQEQTEAPRTVELEKRPPTKKGLLFQPRRLGILGPPSRSSSSSSSLAHEIEVSKVHDTKHPTGSKALNVDLHSQPATSTLSTTCTSSSSASSTATNPINTNIKSAPSLSPGSSLQSEHTRSTLSLTGHSSHSPVTAAKPVTVSETQRPPVVQPIEPIRAELKTEEEATIRPFPNNNNIQQEQKPLVSTSNGNSNTRIKPNTLTINGRQYARLELIGKGGSSKVFKVLSLSDGRLLALKRVGLRGLDESTLSGYLNEIELLRKLAGSEHIIQLYDADINRQEGYLHMVMECGEIDLAGMLQRHKETRLSINSIRVYWEQASTILLCVCDD